MGLTRPKFHQINSSKTAFDDPILELNANLTGSNTTDIGFIFNRGTTGDNVALLWDHSAQEFVMITTSNSGSDSGDIVQTSLVNLKVNQISTENLAFPTTDGTNGQVLVTDGTGNLSFQSPQISWGDITGTLSNQTDLNTELSSKLDGNSTIISGTY